jgi:hypothetical protein
MTHRKKILYKFAVCFFASMFCLAINGSCEAAADGFIIDKYDPARCFNGVTLFADVSDGARQRIVEVDMDGSVVWEYAVPGELFAGRKGRKNIVMDVKRLSGGNTLFIIQEVGIYEIDKGGKVLWSHLDNAASHSVQRLQNGNTLYTRGWAGKGDNHAVEVNTEGNIVWSWNGIAQFSKSSYEGVYDQGWIHVNSATRLDNGNTLLSLRNFNLIAEVNKQGDVAWKCDLTAVFSDKKQTSSKAHPHSPDILANGDILVALTAMNIVAECKRPEGRAVQIWAHPDKRRIAHIRGVNRLPNGNTLIVEANKIVEFTPDWEVVWQMTQPGIVINERSKNSFLFKAQRIAR